MFFKHLKLLSGVAWVSSTALLAAGLSACSETETAGVSTVETENAYIIQVVDEGGSPVVNASAVLRVAGYLPDFGALEKSVGQKVKLVAQELTSDSAGFIHIDELFEDSLTLEVMDGNRGAFVELVASNIQKGDSAELTLNRLGVMAGKVNLPEGEEFAWVRIYGTDRVVKTDKDGNYEIEGLAPADYRIQMLVADSVSDDVVTVKSVVEKSSSSSAPESSSSEEPESSSSLPDYLDVLDFENGLKSNIVFAGELSELYLKPTDTTVVMNPVEDSAALAIVDAGAGREGKAYHWTTSGKTGHWSFMGLWMCSSTKPCDFSGLDSVEYYVRGTGSYSFNLETIVSGSSGKAVFLDTLNGSDEWERVVVKPSDFMVGDSTYGNVGWDGVRKQVTNIAVPAYFDTEIWIDDIKFYGVNEDDL